MYKKFLSKFRKRKEEILPLAGELVFSPRSRRMMLDHVQQEAPRLVVGFMIGTNHQVVQTCPARNLFRKERGGDTFLPDPEDWNRTMQIAAKQGLSIIGIYQSVIKIPQNPPIDSFSMWRSYPGFMVVYVQHSRLGRLEAFSINGNNIQKVTVAEGDLDEEVDRIRRHFEANACLGIYTWMERLNVSWKLGNTVAVSSLFSEIEQSGYPLWPTAAEVVQTLKQRFQNGASHFQDHEDNLAFLVQTAKEASPEVKRLALLALRDLDQIDTLAQILNLPDADEQLYMLSIALLRTFEGRSVKIFSEGLYHRHWFVRQQSAEGLGECGTREDAPALVEVLNNDLDTDVCAAAIRSLGKIGTKASISELQNLFEITLCDSNGNRLDSMVQDAIKKILARDNLTRF
jgi:hypothetical protein